MSRRYVAVSPEQKRRRGDRSLEGALDLNLSAPQRCQHLRCLAQVAGDLGADVSGRRESALSLDVTRAEICRSSQRLDAADSVAPGKDPSCRGLELARHRFVRPDGRLREM